MAKRTVLSEKSVNAEADAFASLMDGGFIDIFDGAQPADADTALNGQTCGVSLTFGRPAFNRAAGGQIIANDIPPAVAARSINPATWARVYRSDHKTPVMDVSVGTRDATIILPTVNIPANITVTCSFFSHTLPKAAN